MRGIGSILTRDSSGLIIGSAILRFNRRWLVTGAGPVASAAGVAVVGQIVHRHSSAVPWEHHCPDFSQPGRLMRRGTQRMRGAVTGLRKSIYKLRLKCRLSGASESGLATARRPAPAL